MRAATARDDLLLELSAARTLVTEAIAGMTEDQMSLPALDGWSVKDHLNHLTACDEFRFFEIERVSRRGAPGYANLTGEPGNTFNEIVVSLRRSLTTEQVLGDLQAARARILEAIAAAPERALSPELYGADGFPINGSISHDSDHAVTIRAWRERSGI